MTLIGMPNEIKPVLIDLHDMQADMNATIAITGYYNIMAQLEHKQGMIQKHTYVVYCDLTPLIL